MTAPRAKNDRDPSAHVSEPEKPRRSPQQERSRVTVEAILEAAGLLLVEKGLAGASTNAIAIKAGVSIGSLYQYFPNKESIFLALLERHHEEMRPIRAKAINDLAAGEPVGTVLDEVMRVSLAARLRHPELMTAMQRELAGLAAKHRLEGTPESGAGADILAKVLLSRKDLANDQTGEKAWLAITILEVVGRGLVHGSMPDLDREALIALTVNACQGLLE
jgi:AcrR family transcriptional regulator